MNTKICFVALSAYPLLAGKKSTRVIGPSVHTVLLARELIKHNFDVAFVTYDEGGPPVEYIDGIEVIKAYPYVESPIPHPVLKAFKIWKAMGKADADIYFHHAGASGSVPVFSRLKRRKFVYNISSDGYFTSQGNIFGFLDRFGNWLDIKLADEIIALNEFQGAMLRKKTGRDCVVIRNHFPLTPAGMPGKAAPPVVLWVGSMSPVKQPGLFLELAEAIPEARFQIIGGAGDGLELYQKVKEASAKIPNLQLLGVVPFDEINQYYSRATVLVNTSNFEGFPYAFVQAWMNYTPVVSLNSDPDEVICKYKMGFHSKTFEQMVEDVKTLLRDEQLRRQLGDNGRRYVEENHDINKIIKQHVQVFRQLVKSDKAGGRK